MKNLRNTFSRMLMLVVVILGMFAMTAAVSAYDSADDNYLLSLGLENGDCSPEFDWATLEYNITVPAGTTELELYPETSAPNARIVDITGTELDENGNGTVNIIVESENGVQLTYVLNVTGQGGAAAQPETENAEEAAKQAQIAAESEAEAERLRLQAESEAEAKRMAAVNEKQAQIDLLKKENDDFAYRIDLLMKLLYGLIGFAVLLLFVLINQSLRNKDMKDEVKYLKSQTVDSYDFARKDMNFQNDFYYTQPPVNDGMYPPQDMAPMAPEPEPEQPLSRKELKKKQKEEAKAKKAAAKMNQVKEEPQPVPMPQEMPAQMPQENMPPMPTQMQTPPQQMPPQPVQPVDPPVLVQPSVEEPDVDVDMIEL